MRWSSKGRSGDLEDVRGRRISPGMAIGGGGGLIGLILALVFGIGGGSGPGQGGSGGGVGLGPSTPGSPEYKPSPEEEKLVDFVSFVLDDIQAVWTTEFQKRGETYQRAKLVVFTGEVPSACGRGEAAMGPFYCPADQKAYIDLSFYDLLHKRFKAPGDFAQAYVIAHEIGHHVQNLRGISTAKHQEMQANPDRANDISVRQELQADCLAGVWAHYANQRGILEMGDLDEGLVAANAIGDDTLQKQATGRVVPESFTHGSAEQRKRWFKIGFDAGKEEVCDTYRTKLL
ncbi:MAG: zinc metallopeptidase [Deltaproteobacteria bacterium]|nr:zinc metallopeptidase [Deltaproteobacteria bacterium]